MGKVLSVAAGKVQRFNVENRAQKVIARDKPIAAPKFEANVKELERILRGKFIKNKFMMFMIEKDTNINF